MFELDIFTSSSRRRSFQGPFCCIRFNPITTLYLSQLFRIATKMANAVAMHAKTAIVAAVIEYSSDQFELILSSFKSYKMIKRTRIRTDGGSINRKVILKCQLKTDVLLLYHESIRNVELRQFHTLKTKLSFEFSPNDMNKSLPEYDFPAIPYDMDYVYSAGFIAVSCGSFVVKIPEKDTKQMSILQGSGKQCLTDIYDRVKYDEKTETLLISGSMSVILMNFNGETPIRTRILSSQTLNRSCRNFGWDLSQNLLFFARRLDNDLEDILMYRFSNANDDLALEVIIPSKVMLSMSYNFSNQSILYMNPPTVEGREVRAYRISKKESMESYSLIREGSRITTIPERFADFAFIGFTYIIGNLCGKIFDPFTTFRT